MRMSTSGHDYWRLHKWRTIVNPLTLFLFAATAFALLDFGQSIKSNVACDKEP